MKALKYFFYTAFLFVAVLGCKKGLNNDTSFAESAATPSKLTAFFTITQDNTGLVTITPNGEGGTYYDIYYGDATATPTKTAAGKSIQHTYPEGVYKVKIIGYNVNGKTTEATQQLTVSFKAYCKGTQC